MWCIYTMEYYLTTRPGEIQPYATTRMNPEDAKGKKSDGKKHSYAGYKTESNE